MSDVPIDALLHGDSLEVLARLPAGCVDLVFADPPYNLQLQRDLWRPNNTHVDAVDDAWDQFDDLAAYDAFTRAWLSAVRRVMNTNATIWVSGTYHNIFRVGSILQDMGFWLLNTVTWHKWNAMPNFRGTRLKNDVEFVIWAARSEKSKYTFNHHEMKQFNDGKQLGSVWAIPACGGAERLRDEAGRKLHSTQKPESLLTRILLASSVPGDLVLDPFAGTATTGAVAKRLRRQFVMIERDPVYVQAAARRLDSITPLDEGDPLLRHRAQEKPPRIPFRTLIQRGKLQIGQALYLDTPAATAIIRDDGLLHANGYTGSIHKVGALLKNSPSCNGWVHWSYRDEATGDLLPLDTLRERIRAEEAKRT